MREERQAHPREVIGMNRSPGLDCRVRTLGTAESAPPHADHVTFRYQAFDDALAQAGLKGSTTRELCW
jgi:hypothetical protein